MAGNEQIAAEVAANPNGIGYVGFAYIQAAGIKVVAIDGKKPTPQAVLDSSYIYSRPTFFYTNGTPGGEAAKFIEFALSDAGKRIAANIGFVPPQ